MIEGVLYPSIFVILISAAERKARKGRTGSVRENRNAAKRKKKVVPKGRPTEQQVLLPVNGRRRIERRVL